MSYSLSDLATRVGKDLGLIAAEETPSAADLDWLSETCSAEIAMLHALALPIWNGADVSVPLEYLTPLSRRIGLAVAASYGLADPSTAMLAMREAERPLTVMAAPRLSKPLKLRGDDAKPGTGGHFTFATG
jgi:hypothetical protein